MNATPVGPESGVVYPVGLRLHGRRVVVVGGGQVAHRRVAGLLEAGARVTVVSPEVTPALEALVEPGSLTWVRRRYEPGDLDGAWYAVAATDDPRGERRGRRGGRARPHLLRPRRRPVRLQRLDARRRAARRPGRGRARRRRSAAGGGVRDAVVAGLTDGSIADRAARTPPAAGPAASCSSAAGPATRG